MRYPSIISEAQAEELNAKIMKIIDKRLFLFCNFEPTPNYSISPEGQYYLAIQDLYKYTIDSFALAKYWNYINHKDRFKFNAIKEAQDFASMIRSATDHNQSSHNGAKEREIIKNYKMWIKTSLNKDTPESINDFEKLVNILKDYADRFTLAVSNLIDYIDTLDNKQSIINRLIEDTLDWYCKSKSEIYFGLLMDEYEFRARTELSHVDLKYRTFNWVKQYLQVQLDEKNDIYFSIVKCIEDTEYCYQRFHFHSNDSVNRQKLEKRKTDTEKDINRLSSKINDINNKKTNAFSVLKENLKETLKETMLILDDKSQSYTLLPQDIMQESIELQFRAIRSPNGDF